MHKVNSTFCLLLCRICAAKRWLKEAHASCTAPSQQCALSAGTPTLEAVDDGVEELQPRSTLSETLGAVEENEVSAAPMSLKGDSFA